LALDKLDFAYGLHIVWAVGAVHRSGFDEHGGADVVPAIHIIR
jgi:hypothetical protein